MGNIICPVCGGNAQHNEQFTRMLILYDCPICGRYELSLTDEEDGVCEFDKNHLAAYLTYHKYNLKNKFDRRYNTVLSKEECDHYKAEFESGHDINGIPVHMNSEIVETWYPRTFDEKVDRILLYVADKTVHVGQIIEVAADELISALFLDRFDVEQDRNINKFKFQKRDEGVVLDEARFILEYLSKAGYLIFAGSDDVRLQLTASGYKAVDEIQRNVANGRDVLVAMRFGDETINLREAIRKGIGDAGYFAVFIDEVQHNDFITPELLKHIKTSKFVVVDLTHQNNGAYFEEGYAMGLGKQVIQLCKKGVNLHFDIAQKNTIMWEKEDDIPEKLKNRIVATID